MLLLLLLFYFILFSIPTESLIDIIGYVVKPANKVKSCTVSDYELQIKGTYTVSKTTKAKLPYTFESATRPDEKFVKVNY